MLEKYLPAMRWLSPYRKEYLKGDLIAGLTVGVMLIPQGMAYAMLAGLPPIYGLYAASIPLVIYAIFGTSRQLAVGPVAMVSLLIVTGVAHLAPPGSDMFIQLAILLALMVGASQLLLGLFKLGFLVNFLSHPVISGFTSAAALIIGFSQLKHLLGMDLPRTSFIHEIVLGVFSASSGINMPTMITGLGGILLIVIVKKINKNIPGPLLVVLVGIAAVYVFRLDLLGVKIVSEIPKGLPDLSIPYLGWEELKQLFPTAITIGLIGFMESIAVAKALWMKHKDYDIDANQELIALGLSNVAGSFFGSFPTGGGFGRSAVNDQAGAKTPLASIISAGLIVLTLLFLTPLFFYLPHAILASIIMVAVFGLIDFKEAAYLWKTDRTDFYMLLATFLATLGLGIELGIVVGVVLSLTMVVYKSAYPHVASLGQVPGTHHYRNVDRFNEVINREDVLIIRFDAPLFFGNTGYFQEHIQNLARKKGDKLRLIIINAEPISSIDSSAVHVLADIIEQFRKQGVIVVMTAVIGPVRDVLYKSGLIALIGEENLYMHVHDAINNFDESGPEDGKRLLKVATQTNVSPGRIRNRWD